jgi:hypothetical protein
MPEARDRGRVVITVNGRKMVYRWPPSHASPALRFLVPVAVLGVLLLMVALAVVLVGLVLIVFAVAAGLILVAYVGGRLGHGRRRIGRGG